MNKFLLIIFLLIFSFSDNNMYTVNNSYDNNMYTVNNSYTFKQKEEKGLLDLLKSLADLYFNLVDIYFKYKQNELNKKNIYLKDKQIYLNIHPDQQKQQAEYWIDKFTSSGFGLVSLTLVFSMNFLYGCFHLFVPTLLSNNTNQIQEKNSSNSCNIKTSDALLGVSCFLPFVLLLLCEGRMSLFKSQMKKEGYKNIVSEINEYKFKMRNYKSLYNKINIFNFVSKLLYSFIPPLTGRSKQNLEFICCNICISIPLLLIELRATNSQSSKLRDALRKFKIISTGRRYEEIL